MRLVHLSLLWVAYVSLHCCADVKAELRATVSDEQIDLLEDDQLIAAYVYGDPKIGRPYFAHLHAPGGVQVSRNHPPIAGKDKTDHAEFHPGLWLAFGDLSGADNWRLKAKVAHARLVQSPIAGENYVAFAVENRYLTAEQGPETICKELCRYELHATSSGYLLTWDCTFSGDREFWFGDQEEMGLGVRLATPLRVENKDDNLPPGTGTILDSQGRRNAAEVWGTSSNWVDYFGSLGETPAGIAIFCHPKNFRPTYFHARDYGFITANPFATAAFKLGPPSRTVVKPGGSLRLRYGVLLHAGEQLDAAALDDAYQRYVRLAYP